MCEPKNGDDYGQKVREEMGKLAAREGLSDRRATDVENGERYVTTTKFFMVIGSVVVFLLAAFTSMVWPDIRDMEQDFVPRLEINLQEDALEKLIAKEFDLLRQQRKSDMTLLMNRLDDLEEHHDD